MQDTAIVDAIRAALKTALTGWTDWTEDAQAVARQKRPAFAVIMDRDGAVPLSMGSKLEEVSATVQVGLFLDPEGAKPDKARKGPREAIKAAMSTASAAIKEASSVDALLIAGPLLTGTGIEVSSGEDRTARGDLRFSVAFIA